MKAHQHMHKLFFLFVSIYLYQCYMQGEIINNKQQVKKIIQWVHPVPGEEEGSKFISNETLLDPLGRKVKSTSYSPDGKIVVEYSFLYDTSGRMTQKIINDQKSGDISKIILDYQFDDSNRLKLKTEREIGKLSIKEYNYIYLKDGGYKESIFQNSEEVQTREFNAKGLLVSDYDYDSGMLRKYEYDTQGNIIQLNEQAKGRPIRRINYENKYDKENRQLSVKTGGKLKVFEYNNHSELLEEKWYDENGVMSKKVTYTFEYYPDTHNASN